MINPAQTSFLITFKYILYQLTQQKSIRFAILPVSTGNEMEIVKVIHGT